MNKYYYAMSTSSLSQYVPFRAWAPELKGKGRRTRNSNISLPVETIKILDELRGDYTRSIFALRLIEQAFFELKKSEAVKE